MEILAGLGTQSEKTWWWGLSPGHLHGLLSLAPSSLQLGPACSPSLGRPDFYRLLPRTTSFLSSGWGSTLHTVDHTLPISHSWNSNLFWDRNGSHRLVSIYSETTVVSKAYDNLNIQNNLNYMQSIVLDIFAFGKILRASLFEYDTKNDSHRHMWRVFFVCFRCLVTERPTESQHGHCCWLVS